MPEISSARVAHVSLDAPLAPIELEARHRHALLVVSLGGMVLGDVLVPAQGALSAADQQEAIERDLEEPLLRARLAADFTRAARAPDRPEPEVTVSVVVCGGEPALLDSLAALDPPPLEVIAVEARNDGIARARGDVIAFLDDGWTVDPRWLEGIGRAFEDRLVMAVKGYVAPLEVTSHDQLLLGREGNASVPITFDRIAFQVPRVAEGNCFFRREAFDEVGPFSERLGPGQEQDMHHRLFEAGWRVAARPSHIAFRQRQPSAFELGRAGGAKTLHGLLTRRDMSVLPSPRAFRASNLPPKLRAIRALGAMTAPLALRRGERSAVSGPRPAVSDSASCQLPAVTAETPSLSVAIASYQRREPLAHLLETFAHQTYPPDRFEAVVVVDGSTDGTAERARGLDLPYPLRVFEQENRGLAASRNRGAHEASAPIVVFIDDDMAPDPGFLAEHAAAHATARAPVAALGACPPANPGDDLAALALRHWWEDYYRRRSEPDHQWVYTDFGDGNMSLPRSVLDAAGGWDEEFAKQTVRRQDWELAIRLLGTGLRFADVPGARAWHHFESSLATSMRNRRVEGSADVLLGRKHPGVRGHLFLSRYLVDEKGRPRQYRLFAEHAAAGERIVNLGARTSQLLEKAQFRWIAWKSMLRMLSYSYLLGVRETLRTEEDFEEFVAPMRRHELVETVPVQIDRQGTLDLEPAVGAVDLLIEYAGQELARVDALEPEVQWDWDTLTERVVSEAFEPYRAAVRRTPAAAPSA